MLFPTPEYKSHCKWWFSGIRTPNSNEPAVLYSDATDCPDQIFGEYRGRVGESCNGSLLIKSLRAEDAGWYRVQCDMKPESNFYSLKVVDPVCNISIVRICTEEGVELICNNTEKKYKPFWTHNRQRLRGSDNMPQKINISRTRAHGLFQCNISCGVSGLKQADITLTSSDCKRESDKSLKIGLGLGLGIPILVLFLIAILYWKREWLGARINAPVPAPADMEAAYGSLSEDEEQAEAAHLRRSSLESEEQQSDET